MVRFHRCDKLAGLHIDRERLAAEFANAMDAVCNGNDCIRIRHDHDREWPFVVAVHARGYSSLFLSIESHLEGRRVYGLDRPGCDFVIAENNGWGAWP